MPKKIIAKAPYPSSVDGPSTVSEKSKSKLQDLVSGKTVIATPEEREAVQPFLKRLLDDYGYPKAHLLAHPQWRVKAAPSDTGKKYPVDIAIFSDENHSDDTLYIVVECKKKKRRDGRSQLEDYLRLSKARVGVWFNGQETLYLLKVEKAGKVVFVDIPSIPRFQQRIEDIGLFKRKDLRPTSNLKATLRSIRNYLAGQAVGTVRDEVFAQELINIIFCKIYDERFTKPSDVVTFRAGIEESWTDVHKRITSLFEKVKEEYADVLDKDDKISLDPASLTYVVGELQNYCLMDSERDAVADAFEIFIGPSLKGSQGQFFTPRNVVKLVVGILSPTVSSKIIDPACGSGGFLVEALKLLWSAVQTRGEHLHWPQSEIDADKQRVAIKNVRGIDKDSFLSKVAKAYMAILGDGRGGVFCENSLAPRTSWQSRTRDEIPFDSFTHVLTNPPFGKKIKIDGEDVLNQFKLAKRWSSSKSESQPQEGAETLESQAPQILFLERCLQLLQDGGHLGIILPESLFCNPSHRFVTSYLAENAKIHAVISMPEELFQPYTHAKACVAIIEKSKGGGSANDPVFMGIAKWCGHDSRGLPIPHDDVPKILARYQAWKAGSKLSYDRLGFVLKRSEIRNGIYLPKYYNPEIKRELKKLKATHDLLSFQDLADQHGIEVTTGHEIGKLSYGTGTIPFIRSSDISNWEIKIDAKHGVSEEIYERFQKKQNVKEHDILMVRDGTYLVGTCAMITKYDTRILFQSHIYKITTLDHEKLDPYLLLAVLSSPIVKEQIYSKRFTQDIIDTLGSRLFELIIPIPKDKKTREAISAKVREVIKLRSESRFTARQAILNVAPTSFGEESLEDPPISA